jgi:opacity protein-like surface antigen
MMAGKLRIFSAAAIAAALLAGPAEAAKHSKTPMPKTDTSQIQPPIYGWAGQYRGTDPDPNIRFQLMRDQNLR